MKAKSDNNGHRKKSRKTKGGDCGRTSEPHRLIGNANRKIVENETPIMNSLRL